jgi:Immunity protein 22
VITWTESFRFGSAFRRHSVLEGYVEVNYTTDESPHLSRFGRDFGTGWYDHDRIETSLHPWSTRSLPDLLQGCSYDSLIVPKFVELCGDFLPTPANCLVLLYDFRHNGNSGPGNGAGDRVILQYLGSIKVAMPWPD